MKGLIKGRSRNLKKNDLLFWYIWMCLSWVIVLCIDADSLMRQVANQSHPLPLCSHSTSTWVFSKQYHGWSLTVLFRIASEANIKSWNYIKNCSMSVCYVTTNSTVYWLYVCTHTISIPLILDVVSHLLWSLTMTWLITW